MLKAEHVTIKFGGLTAVNDVSVELEERKIYGLIGPNGAGKTTFFNCISGVYTPNTGTVVFDGKHLEGKKPHEVNEAGIARTYQVINLFRSMSVIDNVRVGMHTQLKSGFFSSMLHLPKERAEERAALREAYEWLEFVGLKEKADWAAGNLSYGEQRLLEIVRGLASRPRLILLDEPAAGMNSTEKVELDALLKEILTRGVGILMVEHDMKLMMGICDYIFVLNQGRLLSQGTPEQIQHDPDVISAYLGGNET